MSKCVTQCPFVQEGCHSTFCPAILAPISLSRLLPPLLLPPCISFSSSSPSSVSSGSLPRHFTSLSQLKLTPQHSSSVSYPPSQSNTGQSFVHVLVAWWGRYLFTPGAASLV